MTESEKEYVAFLYNEGIDPEDIAELTGIDETKVIEYCAEILGDL